SRFRQFRQCRGIVQQKHAPGQDIRDEHALLLALGTIEAQSAKDLTCKRLYRRRTLYTSQRIADRGSVKCPCAHKGLQIRNLARVFTGDEFKDLDVLLEPKFEPVEKLPDPFPLTPLHGIHGA